MINETLGLAVELFGCCNSMPRDVSQVDVIRSVGGDVAVSQSRQKSLVLLDENSLEIAPQ